MITTPGLGLQDLPGKNCGACGFRSCAGLAERLENEPEMIRRCIQISENRYAEPVQAAPAQPPVQAAISVPDTAKPEQNSRCYGECHTVSDHIRTFKDSLGRDFDFYLEHFPEDPGPREIVLPHNPMLTREMDVKVGDIMIGRPLGMSCGCPITHCGIVREVDQRTGVMVWCVTGPLGPRQHGFKDIGYYIAEGYEGMITESNVTIEIGRRYFFQPRMCMLQWRHSGLVNFINRTPKGLQVRLEGLWIG